MKMFSLCTPGSLGAVSLVIGLSSVLAGCSAEPSASDIDNVMRADAASSKSIVIHEIRKIGCAAAQGAAGFMCDVEVDATVTMGWPFPTQRSRTTTKVRFFEDGGKWKVSTN